MKYMATTKTTSTYLCPNCIATGMEPWHHGRAHVLSGTKYCGLCAAEIADAVVMNVDTRARARPVTWDGHAISVRAFGTFIIVDVTCTCTRPVRPARIYRSASVYMDWLARFVEHPAHFTPLRGIVGDHA